MTLDPDGSVRDPIMVSIVQHPIHGKGWWWTVKPSEQSAYHGYAFTKWGARRRANRCARRIHREANTYPESWTV